MRAQTHHGLQRHPAETCRTEIMVPPMPSLVVAYDLVCLRRGLGSLMGYSLRAGVLISVGLICTEVFLILLRGHARAA